MGAWKGEESDYRCVKPQWCTESPFPLEPMVSIRTGAFLAQIWPLPESGPQGRSTLLVFVRRVPHTAVVRRFWWPTGMCESRLCRVGIHSEVHRPEGDVRLQALL